MRRKERGPRRLSPALRGGGGNCEAGAPTCALVRDFAIGGHDGATLEFTPGRSRLMVQHQLCVPLSERNCLPSACRDWTDRFNAAGVNDRFVYPAAVTVQAAADAMARAAAARAKSASGGHRPSNSLFSSGSGGPRLSAPASSTPFKAAARGGGGGGSMARWPSPGGGGGGGASRGCPSCHKCSPRQRARLGIVGSPACGVAAAAAPPRAAGGRAGHGSRMMAAATGAARSGGGAAAAPLPQLHQRKIEASGEYSVTRRPGVGFARFPDRRPEMGGGGGGGGGGVGGGGGGRRAAVVHSGFRNLGNTCYMSAVR